MNWMRILVQRYLFTVKIHFRKQIKEGWDRITKLSRVFPAENKTRCPVRLFLKYLSLLPESKACGKIVFEA